MQASTSMTDTEFAEFKTDQERQRAYWAAHRAKVNAFEARQFTVNECIWIAAAFKGVMAKYLDTGVIETAQVFLALNKLEDSVIRVEAEEPFCIYCDTRHPIEGDAFCQPVCTHSDSCQCPSAQATGRC